MTTKKTVAVDVEVWREMREYLGHVVSCYPDELNFTRAKSEAKKLLAKLGGEEG